MKHKHIKAYMECAEAFAKCSPATRLKVGAVIVKDNRVISCGYNAQPEHINDPCELPDGTTDPRVRHAEKNALMGLVRSNQSAVGADLFCTHSCCVYCAIDIVDAGIKRVYFGKHYRDDSGLEYLRNNGVEVVETIPEEIGSDIIDTAAWKAGVYRTSYSNPNGPSGYIVDYETIDKFAGELISAYHQNAIKNSGDEDVYCKT